MDGYTNLTATLDDMNIAYVLLDQVTLDTIPYVAARVSDECTAKEGYLLQEYSVLYDIVGDTVLEGVPSWHHQSILSTDGTDLKVVGVTKTCGLDMIEAVHRTDKSFVLGIQFHPEAAVAKHMHGAKNASAYMSKEQAEAFFARFYEAVTATSVSLSPNTRRR